MLPILIAAEFALAAGAGSRGEQRAEMTAKASSDDLTLSLGAATFSGPQAPQRQELALGVQAGVFKGEIRAVPIERIKAEIGLQFANLSVGLAVRRASFERMDLRGAGARVELEGDLTDGIHAGLSASAWALQLDAPSGADAWLRWGLKTTDWAQRAEIGAWLSRELGEHLCLTPSISLAQSAQPGVYEARASLVFEMPLGPVKLRAEPAVARQFPELWVLDLTVGASLTL